MLGVVAVLVLEEFVPFGLQLFRKENGQVLLLLEAVVAHRD